ncbi:MAG: hypothetical protein QUV05_20955 [Phycisphaerae bacterium]|nr:hypothetical protein [Phycisphaerae bacterium]
MSKRKQTVSQALRQAIIDSGLNTLRIEEATGVNNAVLSRFLREERGLNLATVDALADMLDLELRPREGRSCPKRMTAGRQRKQEP